MLFSMDLFALDIIFLSYFLIVGRDVRGSFRGNDGFRTTWKHLPHTVFGPHISPLSIGQNLDFTGLLSFKNLINQ